MVLIFDNKCMGLLCEGVDERTNLLSPNRFQFDVMHLTVIDC